MRSTTIALATLVTLLASGQAIAGPAEDATAAVTTLLDKFNAGDAKAFLAAHRADALIVDEFGNHLWSGPGSAQRWLDDYAKDAKQRGISGGRVDYGKPLQANSDGASAYVVLPTVYRLTQNGAKLSGAGSMTFVMKKDGNDWKIASWTYSGAAWAPQAPAK
jgi:ketosteroid isomerase-like protein